MKKLSPLLLAVLALLSCVEKPNSNLKSDNIIIDNPEYGSLQSLASPPITFELIQTFADNEDMDDELLANISSIFVDDNQNVYVLDSYSSKIISYSRSGEIRWIVDSPGKGPGDLNQPTGMIWNNSNLFYLSNLNGARIDVFNLKGEFIESLSLPDNKELFELVGYSNDNLVLANVIRGAFAKKFSIFDINNLSSAQTSFVVDVSGELTIPFTST